MIIRTLICALAVLGLAACDSSSQSSSTGASTPAAAGDVNPYTGKNVTYIVTTNAGGGYDAYARLIAPRLNKYLGSKNVLIENIPGAGHIVGTNTLWKAKPDGFTIGTFTLGLIYNQLIHRSTLQFDLREFVWIGKAAGEPRSIVLAKGCPAQNMEQLVTSTETLKFAAAGVGSSSYTETKLLKEALNLNVEVLPGFDGTEGEMSMMRGEVCGTFGTTSSLLPFVTAGEGHYVLTVGGEVDGVPNVWEYVKDDRAKSIISIIEALAKLGRATAAPPGLPKEMYDRLLAAYKSALADPDLLAEAARLNYPIETAFGDEVKQLITDALNQTPETVAILAEIVKLEDE